MSICLRRFSSDSAKIDIETVLNQVAPFFIRQEVSVSLCCRESREWQYQPYSPGTGSAYLDGNTPHVLLFFGTKR